MTIAPQGIVKATVFNLAAPGANTNILGSAITPTASPSVCRVTVNLAVASVFKGRLTRGETTFDVKLNGGATLVAGSLYMFDVPWETGDSLNFRVETNGIIQVLKALEVGAQG